LSPDQMLFAWLLGTAKICL